MPRAEASKAIWCTFYCTVKGNSNKTKHTIDHVPMACFSSTHSALSQKALCTALNTESLLQNMQLCASIHILGITFKLSITFLSWDRMSLEIGNNNLIYSTP